MVCGQPGLGAKDKRETGAQHRAGKLEVHKRQQKKLPQGQERKGEAEAEAQQEGGVQEPRGLLGDDLQPTEEPGEKMLQDPSARGQAV